MMMQHKKFLKLLLVLTTNTFLCVPCYGNPADPVNLLNNGGTNKAKEESPERSEALQGSSFEAYLRAFEREQSEENLQPKVTLQETLERAYMQNTDLDATRAQLRATDEEVSQAIGQWRPSLSVQGVQRQQQQYPIGRGTTAHNSLTEYTATITQNIYNGGGTIAAIGQAESNVLAGKASLFTQEQKTLFTAIGAHTTILQDEAIVKYRIQNMNSLKKIMDQAQARFEVGEGSRTDVEAAKADYEGAKADLSVAIGELESDKAIYLRQVGSPPGKLATANVMLELPKVYEDAFEIAKTNNPQIILARYELEAALYGVNLKLSQLLPELNVEASVGNDRSVQHSRTGRTRTSSISKSTNFEFDAILDIPIYSQGIPNSEVRQAYQIVAQQKVLLVQAMRQVEQDVKVAWDDLIAVRESVKGLLAQVKAQELSIEGAMEEVNVGTKTIIDVLFLQQDLISAQINLAQSQAQLVNAGYQVIQTMGRLTARDLKLKVKYYDPDAYYNEYKNAWIQFWQGKDWRYVKDGDKK